MGTLVGPPVVEPPDPRVPPVSGVLANRFIRVRQQRRLQRWHLSGGVLIGKQLAASTGVAFTRLGHTGAHLGLERLLASHGSPPGGPLQDSPSRRPADEAL